MKVECLRVFDGTAKLVYGGKPFADLPIQKFTTYKDIEDAFAKFQELTANLRTNVAAGTIEELERGTTELTKQTEQLEQSISDLEREVGTFEEQSW